MRWRVSEEDEEGEEGEPKEYVDGLLWGGGDRNGGGLRVV